MMSARVVGAARNLPALAAILGGLAALATAIGIGSAAGAFLAGVLPVDPADVDPVEALAGAVGLLALGVGLWRGRRLARLLGVLLFVAAVIAQLLVLKHPVAAGEAVAAVVVLAVDRRRYTAPTEGRTLRTMLLIGVVAFAVLILEAGIVDASLQDHGPIAAFGDATASIVDDVALAGPDLSGLTLPAPTEELETIARLCLLALALLTLRVVHGPRTDGGQSLRARSVAAQHAVGALRPFQVGADLWRYLARGTNGVITYGQAGRTVVILGDPIGPPADARAALRAFVNECHAADLRVGVYQARPEWRSELETIGFRCLRIGSEAVIELPGFSLEGSHRANLRHTCSRAARGGVEVAWFGTGIADPRLRAMLAEVDSHWRSTVGPELTFTINRFDVVALESTATAVAFEADGSVGAFATFQPGGAGRWVLDLIRRRSRTPGAIESCLVVAIERFRDLGGSELSLGLVALARLDDAPPASWEATLARLVPFVRHLYDVNGLAFFKNKFEPRWEERYVAVEHRFALPSFALAVLRLHVAGRDGSLRRSAVALFDAARHTGAVDGTVRTGPLLAAASPTTRIRRSNPRSARPRPR